MSEQPLISVIIRTYNSADRVTEAVETALEQTLDRDRYEVIVVDDGSEDSTLEVLEDYSDCIRIIEKEHSGAVETLNHGIWRSQGKYFTILDSDDRIRENALEKLYEVLKGNEETYFAYSDYVEEKPDGTRKRVSTADNLFKTLAGGILFRKIKVVELGLYDPDLVFPEYDLIAKMKSRGQEGEHVPEPLYVYRRTEDSITMDSEKVEEGKKQLERRHGMMPEIRRY